MTRRSAAALALACLLLAGFALIPASGPRLQQTAGPRRPLAAPAPLDLLYLDDGRPLRLRIAVELDGRPLDAVWDDTFYKLFADLDRDGDGFLSREEARRAPSALRIRQLSWGLFFAVPAPPPWEELDRNPADGKVSFDELADYYRRHGVGRVQAAVGRAPATDALTDSLLRGLDRDSDGQVSQAEWLAAADSLHALDLNDDELISGDELVAGLSYPGAFGGTLLTPWSPDDPPSSLLDSFPCLQIPEQDQAKWAQHLLTRRGMDHKGATQELAGLLDQPPDFSLLIRLGQRMKDDSAVEWSGHTAADVLLLDLGRTMCAMRTGESRLTTDLASAFRLARQRFKEADADHDGKLDRSEAEKSSFAPLRDLFDAADRDADGRVSAEEWSAHLDLLSRLAEGQIVLTILDHGRGLFELLDADRDGVLSVRELRGAWARLKAAGCLHNGSLDRSLLPRQVRCVVSQGRPYWGRKASTRGPAWFRAMDRNGDGDVSRREFLGDDAEFKRLDADGDGLISAEEAEQAEGPRGTRP